MSPGFPNTRQDWDSQVGRVTANLEAALQEAADLFGRLGKYQDADLIALPAGGSPFGQYLQADVDAIRANFSGFNKLNDIAHARDIQSPANDFFFNAWKLLGVTLP